MNSCFLSFINQVDTKLLYQNFATKEARILYQLEDNFFKPFIFQQESFLNLINNKNLNSIKDIFNYFKNVVNILQLDCSFSKTTSKSKLGYFHPNKNTIFISLLNFDINNIESKYKLFYTFFHEISHAFSYKYFDDLYHGNFFIFSLQFIFGKILNIHLEINENMFDCVLFFDYFKNDEFLLSNENDIINILEPSQLKELKQYNQYLQYAVDSDFIDFWIFSFYNQYIIFKPLKSQQRLEKRLLNKFKKI